MNRHFSKVLSASRFSGLCTTLISGVSATLPSKLFTHRLPGLFATLPSKLFTYRPSKLFTHRLPGLFATLPSKLFTYRPSKLFTHRLPGLFSVLLSALFAALCLSLPLRAQTVLKDYSEILRLIDPNSPALKAVRMEAEAEIMEHHTGLVPDNPEVGFTYWRSNSDGSPRWDFSATQSFDFPSVYAYQARTARLSDSATLYRYKAARAQIMAEAEQACLELVYINSLLHQSFGKRAETAVQLAEMTKAQLDKGQLSIIEYNKAQLELLGIEKNTADLNMRKAALYAQLRRYTGGADFVLEQDDLPEIGIPADFESFLEEAAKVHPVLKQAQNESLAAGQQVKANTQEWLPSLSVGYLGEHVFDEGFHGVQVGISLPLWQNKNRVKQARLELQAAQNRELDAQYQFREQMETLYNTVAQLLPVVQKYRENLNLHNNLPFLDEALQNGEFSPMEYLLELQYHFDMIDSYLQAEFELASAYCRLMWMSGLR